MSPSDRNLLALAETTPLAKLAGWMGLSLHSLERKLARLRLRAEANALLHPERSSPASPPERERRQPEALKTRPLPTPEPRVPVRLVPPSRFGDPRTVEILRPFTPARLAYAQRFDAAGWSLAEIAWLFDADAEALAAAIRTRVA